MRYHEYLAAGYPIATGLMLSGSPVALNRLKDQIEYEYEYRDAEYEYDPRNQL